MFLYKQMYVVYRGSWYEDYMRWTVVHILSETR